MTWSANNHAERRRTLVAVGAVAFLIRVIVAMAMNGLSRPEVNEYNSMARALVAGRGYIFGHLGIIYHSYAPPLHTWLTVASYWVSHSLVPNERITGGALLAALAPHMVAAKAS